MQSCEKCLDPKNSQLISVQKPGFASQRFTLSSLFAAIKGILQSLFAAAIAKNELKIWQETDRFGNIWWYALDPATGRSTCVATEDEMLTWIEGRYYHSNSNDPPFFIN